MAVQPFPTREICDLQNPAEAFLWMFVGMPGDLHLPQSYHRYISQRFWDLGARPVEEPVLKLVPPSSVRQTWANPGRWTRVDGVKPKPEETRDPLPYIPTRATCNLADPDEAFLWMWVALPHVRGGPMILPETTHRRQSRHMWDLGARPVEEPTLEYVPASAAQPDWATSAGTWVPMGSVSQEDRDYRALQSGIARLGLAQKAEMREALEANRTGRPLPGTKASDVVRGLTPAQRVMAWELLHDAA